jgi:hypothetical protein
LVSVRRKRFVIFPVLSNSVISYISFTVSEYMACLQKNHLFFTVTGVISICEIILKWSLYRRLVEVKKLCWLYCDTDVVFLVYAKQISTLYLLWVAYATVHFCFFWITKSYASENVPLMVVLKAIYYNVLCRTILIKLVKLTKLYYIIWQCHSFVSVRYTVFLVTRHSTVFHWFV